MRIAVGSDHRGVELKQAIIGLLKGLGHEHHDFGCYSADSVDYPDIAKEVALAVSAGKFDHGMLFCSSGIGMSIAANKVKGVRAALCCNLLSAERARLHNDANVLCLGQDIVGHDMALDIVRIYLSTAFEGGRHLRRIEKIRGIEADLLDKG
ncbi:MAG: ribose 5-phosphate isomerase B [Chloroflexi bacterium]|nr:ribose 5-phosphate isomerase B [Chloroflexota bacterium]MBM3182530.1 ribose 5-phosphate isomerase B [Chloroflexota bacterium]MBM4451146.1 ribose 5-phosphate isomerase B [Chloroflexota bacterium]MBM4454314.1 ribose 5-phosphate isomerase B [Chloroflexota bacterium]